MRKAKRLLDPEGPSAPLEGLGLEQHRCRKDCSLLMRGLPWREDPASWEPPATAVPSVNNHSFTAPFQPPRTRGKLAPTTSFTGCGGLGPWAPTFSLQPPRLSNPGVKLGHPPALYPINKSSCQTSCRLRISLSVKQGQEVVVSRTMQIPPFLGFILPFSPHTPIPKGNASSLSSHTGMSTHTQNPLQTHLLHQNTIQTCVHLNAALVHEGMLGVHRHL